MNLYKLPLIDRIINLIIVPSREYSATISCFHSETICLVLGRSPTLTQEMNILDSQSWDDWGREVPSACDPQPGSSTQNKNNDTEGVRPTPPSSNNQGENTTTEKSPARESIREDTCSKTTGNEQHKSVDNGQVRRKRGRPRLKAKDGEASIQVRVNKSYIPLSFISPKT